MTTPSSEAEDDGSDHIEVSIGWSETVQYSSKIEVQVSEVREWMKDHPRGIDAGEPLTAEVVEEYLRDGPESAWSEQCDTSADFIYVSQRQLDHGGVQVPSDEEADET